MATYKDIQTYVKEQKGFSIKTCWIAEMKNQLGMPMGKASNRYDEDTRTNPCPEGKKASILDAFEHFGMIESR